MGQLFLQKDGHICLSKVPFRLAGSVVERISPLSGLFENAHYYSVVHVRALTIKNKHLK